MLDINDFVTDRGGDPKKIKESQRRRFAPEEAVDRVIALYEEARRGMCTTLETEDYTHMEWVARYEVTRIGSDLNALMKEIGKKKKVKRTLLVLEDRLTGIVQNKEDASDLIEQKAALEKRKKEAEEFAAQRETERDRQIRLIGNYVHDSVPVSNNEVRALARLAGGPSNC